MGLLNQVDQDTLFKMACLVPENQIMGELNKQWIKKTKFLNDLPKNKNQIKGIKTKGTKEIKFKERTCFNWLTELEITNELTIKQKQFIKWFQVEYTKKSYEAITGKKLRLK